MSGRLAVDGDAAWCAWTSDDGRVRALDLAHDPQDALSDLGPGGRVYPAAGSGAFLVVDSGSVFRSTPGRDRVHLYDTAEDALHLEATPTGPASRVAATADARSLVVGPGGGSETMVPTGSRPILLAWARRRKRFLCLTADGVLTRLDPVTGATDAVPLEVDGELVAACYDEVLGGVWTVSAASADEARMHRVEPRVPRLTYRIALGTRVSDLSTAHSGEWLIARDPGAGSTFLVNVNSARAFRAPGRLTGSGAPCAFSFDNRLVAVEADSYEIVEVPARADIRSRDGSLEIATFWNSEPRMHRASRDRDARRSAGAGAAADTAPAKARTKGGAEPAPSGRAAPAGGIRFLSPEDRLPKESLWSRAAACVTELDGAFRNGALDIGAYCRAANRSALVMAMAGDLAESERSCRRQTEVLLGLLRRGELPASETVRVLQPWINIGRLRVIRGRWEEALDHFPDPRRFTDPEPGAELPVCGGVLSPAERDAIAADGAAMDFVTASHVVEKAKALAKGERTDLLGAHVRRWRDRAARIPHLREAAAVLSLREGKSPLQPTARTPVPGPAGLAIRVQAARWDPAHTGALVEELSGSGGPDSADRLVVLRAAAEVLLGHGGTEEGVAVLRLAEKVARAVADEVELHGVLSRLQGLGASDDAGAEASALAQRSGYAVIRRAAGLDPLPEAVAEPRLAALRDSELALMNHVVAREGAR